MLTNGYILPFATCGYSIRRSVSTRQQSRTKGYMVPAEFPLQWQVDHYPMLRHQNIGGPFKTQASTHSTDELITARKFSFCRQKDWKCALISRLLCSFFYSQYVAQHYAAVNRWLGHNYRSIGRRREHPYQTSLLPKQWGLNTCILM